MPNNRNNLLTFNETKEFLNVKNSHLRSLIFKKEIPFIKVGHLIRFDRNELITWIEENSTKEVRNG